MTKINYDETETYMRFTVRIRFVLLALLLTASILPNLGFEINTFGFYWNFYRAAVFLVTLLILVLFRGEIRIKNRGIFLGWMSFLLIWIVYGGILFVLSPYTDRSRGFLELFSLLCGLLVFFGFSGFEVTEREIEGLLRIVFFLLAGLVLLGFYEIVTANHLSTSMFMDEENYVAARVDPHTAAGVMYNVNDFSALLTMMCPAVIGRFRIRCRRCYIDPGWLLIIGVLLINRTNDANICNAALLLGILVYLLVIMSRDRRKIGQVLMGLACLLLILVGLYLAMGSSAGGLVARWQDQVDYMSVGGGSLHARFLIYRDALKAGFNTGFLGLGPAGFPVYCRQTYTESWFVNPHSFLMEIYSQYGLLICLLFLFLIAHLIQRMYHLYRYGRTETVRNHGLIGITMTVVYLTVSFAPSSFIMNAYPWGLLALLCLIWEHDKKLVETSEHLDIIKNFRNGMEHEYERE